MATIKLTGTRRRRSLVYEPFASGTWPIRVYTQPLLLFLGRALLASRGRRRRFGASSMLFSKELAFVTHYILKRLNGVNEKLRILL